MIRSVEEELSKVASRELSDDFLDYVSGGRDMNASELKSAYYVLKKPIRII